MKILFVIDTGVGRMRQESLGIMHISALLKQHGHICEALDLARNKDLVTTAREHAPQLLAFSAITGPHRRLMRASREIKRGCNILSVFGGPHPTYFPQMIEEEGIDIICRGEGEYPMLDLVQALQAGQDFTSTRNLWVKRDGQIYRNPLRPFVQDLDSLPWPDRELLNEFPELHAEDTRHFMGGRGCPYSCTFCFNHIAKTLAEGRYVRRRSVENLIAEIKAVKRQHDMRFITFQDDTFGLSTDWLDEFSAHYRREIGLPFLCHLRADLVTDRVSKVLAEAGCTHVAIGLEAGNDYIRNVVLNKHISREQLINACRSLKAHGIIVSTQNMFGVPFETADTALDTIELNIACKPDQINVYFFVPYPGTRLAQLAVDEGFFQAKDLHSLPEDFTPSFSSVNLKLPHAQQIERLAWLTRLCVRFPILFPLLRSLFKRPRKRQLRTAVVLTLLLLERIDVRIKSARLHVTRDPVHYNQWLLLGRTKGEG